MGCFETFAWLNFGVTHEFEVIANVCGIRLKRNNGNGGVHGINGVLEKGSQFWNLIVGIGPIWKTRIENTEVQKLNDIHVLFKNILVYRYIYKKAIFVHVVFFVHAVCFLKAVHTTITMITDVLLR